MAELLQFDKFFPVVLRGLNQPIILRGGWPELHQILSGDRLIIGAAEFLLDFRLFRFQMKATQRRWLGTKDKATFRIFQLVKLG